MANINLIDTVSEASALWGLYTVSVASPNVINLNSQTNPWSPPQWDGLPAVPSAIKTNIYDGTNYYFFDAVFHADHTTTLKATEHPVQTGASMTDHAYMMPARLTLQVGMSDAMQSLNVSAWGSAQPTKSVSAYRTLVALQQSRVVLTILTRLNRYQNMIIEQVMAPDDYKTQFGMKCTINFRQIMVATIASTTISAAPQVTGSSTGTATAVALTSSQSASLLVKLGASST